LELAEGVELRSTEIVMALVAKRHHFGQSILMLWNWIVIFVTLLANMTLTPVVCSWKIEGCSEN
jgi:hypothetical protein